MQPYRSLASLALVALFGIAACGDDSRPGADASVDDQPDAGSPDAGQDEARCAPAALAGRVEDGAWDPSFTMAGFTGYDGFSPAVHSFARDADGSVLAAGYFLWNGAEQVGPIARLRDGVWELMRPDLQSEDIAAVAVTADGRTALATFRPLLPVFPPEPQTGEILVGDATGLTSVGTFTGVVRTLAWVGDELWVAGHFELESGHAELAVWDGNAWSAPPGGAPNGPVYELLDSGGSLYVGGSFSQIGGVAAQSVAEWTGTEWLARSMSLEPSTPGGAFQGPIVFGLARTLGGDLYAGGLFHPADAPTAGGVARWTGTSWEIVGSGFAQAGGLAGDSVATVSDVTLHQGALHAAGCFTRAGGDESTTLPGVARWNGTSWEALPGGAPGFVTSSWFHSFVCGGEPSGTAILETRFQALHSDGDRLFVGGTLAGVDGVASQSMIAHDGAGWVPYAAPAGNGLVGPVSELAVGGSACDVYAFGRISHAGGESVAGAVVHFDGDRWSAIAPPPQGAQCAQLAVSPAGEVYLGCDTPDFLPGVYRLDAGEWTLLPAIPDVTGTLAVGDLAFDPEGRLWAMGGSGTAGWLARLDGDAFTVIADDFDGNVLRIAFPPGDEPSEEILVAGSFANVGTLAAGGIARHDGSSWQALGDGVTTTPLSNPVNALAWTEDAIYASTMFGGPDHVVLGRWDGTAWEELGVPERGLPPHVNPDGDHQFHELFARGNHVIAAGGIFPEEGGRGVVRFDGETFTPLAGGVGAISVDALAVTPDALWFGGSIATTGTSETLAPSAGVARYELSPAP